MVNICCVYGCCSTGATKGISLHKFPKNKQVKRQWIKFVDTHRSNFVFNPTSSLICSIHFTSSCFENNSQFLMGFQSKRLLCKGAVPTVYKEINDMLTARMTLGDCAGCGSDCVSDTDRPKAKGNGVHISATSNADRSTAKRKLEVARLLVEHEDKRKKVLEAAADTLATIKEKENSLGTSKITQCCIRPYHRSKGIQCDVPVVESISVGTQTDLSLEPIRSSSPISHIDDNESQDGSCSFDPQDFRDTTYIPEKQSESECSMSSDGCHVSSVKIGEVSKEVWPIKEKKFIVFESKLKELLEMCPVCAAHLKLDQICRGTMVTFNRKCGSCGFSSRWSSQPDVSGTESVPAGNLLLSAAILFSGSLPSRILRLFNIMNIAVFTRQTFHKHQKKYLAPTVFSCWKQQQEEIISTLEGELVLTGDCRCDSPGHSAKYGTYTFIEQRINKVIDLQLVQSNEVANANCCELEGFKRSLKVLTEDHHHRIESLVTDRHVQINKYVKEQMIPQGVILNHYFDVWHVAKALHKTLLALSKKKGCESIELWIKSIVNHLYWVATCGLVDSSETQEAKWLSVTNHVQNIHRHESESFPECLHEPGLKRKWIKPGSKAAVLLEDTIRSTKFMKNITRLSPQYQTSSLESFHSLVNRFAPKNESFGHTGMLCRLYLASLHYNENSERLQAVSIDGIPQYSLRTVKYLPGSCTTVRPVKTAPTYEYTVQLLEHLFLIYHKDRSSFANVSLPNKRPLTDGKIRPSKAECITNFTSRFLKNNTT